MIRDHQPRERLLEKGASALSDAELIAILLRTGGIGEDVVSLAEEVLSVFGGLKGMCHASTKEFLSVRGIGIAKATSLSASLELSRRIASVGVMESNESEQWRRRVDQWRISLATESREFIVALFVDDKNRMIDEEKLSFGGLDGASMDMSYLLRRAIRLNASGVAVLHNHPNGTLESSTEDRVLTELIEKRLEVLGIPFLGHFIVSTMGVVEVEKSLKR